MHLQRTVTTDAPIEKVFAFLSDFTSTNDWDPATVRTTLVSGDGDVGTSYHNVSKFGGRETELTYVVKERVPNERITLEGNNKTVQATDTMVFRVNGPGTEVTYTADFEFKGVVKYVAPLLGPAFKKLGNDAEKGLHGALAKL